MSRPLRIEYPDAWYHVMNRGRRLESIFSDEEDYKLFIELLQETSEMWNIRIAAYCLMPTRLLASLMAGAIVPGKGRPDLA